MAAKNRTQLKDLWVTGYVPTEANYDDVWDSFFNLTDGDKIALATDVSGTLPDGNISSAATWNGKQDALTFGIANGNAVDIDAGADIASNDYVKFSTTGLIGQTYAEVKTDLSLNNVENTALSSWAGSANITTVGTIATGTWEGTTIDEAQGGTGITTYEAGDIIYASGVNTLTTLAKGTDTHILTLSGGVPTWAAPSGVSANADTYLPVSNGTSVVDSLLRQDDAPSISDTLIDASTNYIVEKSGVNDATDAIKIVAEVVAGIGQVTWLSQTGNGDLYSIIDDKSDILWVAPDSAGNPVGIIFADFDFEFGNPYLRPIVGTRDNLTNQNYLDFKARIANDNSEALSGASVINPEKNIVRITGTAVNQVMSLAAGVEGQEMTLIYRADFGSNSADITPDGVLGLGFTKITLGTVGDSCKLLYTDGKWVIISNNGGVITV